MSATFNLDKHRRERTRRAERRVSYLEAECDRLIRLLALACRVAAGDEADPLEVLRVLEAFLDTADEIDTSSPPPPRQRLYGPAGPSTDELVELLGRTDPARIGSATAA